MSSRISISSSTTRISGETSDPFCFMDKPLFDFYRPAQRKHHAHGCTPCLFRQIFGRIVQVQLAAMVFENLAHDGEPKTCALRARGDIRLGEAVAVLRRQTDAVVPN